MGHGHSKKVVTPPTGFWVGPYGVLVPDHIQYVIAEDCTNTMFIAGGQTKAAAKWPTLSRKQLRQKYLELYCYKDKSGHWYYIDDIKKELDRTEPLEEDD
jgi:hypothetical protein